MDNLGLTLAEVMITVVVLGILVSGLAGIFGTITRSSNHAANHAQTIGTAPFAMARMVRFISDTDDIQLPVDDASEYGQ